MYSAKILKDSVSPEGHRLTTMELTYPRFIHSELMTHRVFSRNAASSRAIPTPKLLERVEQTPAMPLVWGQNQKGMQSDTEMDVWSKDAAEAVILNLRDAAVSAVRTLNTTGLHKQNANRYIEPWLYITTIVTGTNWWNLFKLRCHPDAQPEFQKIAVMARDAYMASRPEKLGYGEWHMPFIRDEELGLDEDLRKKISTARCARISYLTHDGRRDPEKDLGLHDDLMGGSGGIGHWSPFEHLARPIDVDDVTEKRKGVRLDLETGEYWCGNLCGWRSYRYEFEQESER